MAIWTRLSLTRGRDMPTLALTLRLGLGSVFVIGGWSKLAQLLSSDKASSILTQYLSGDGYINAFFQQYLFEGALEGALSPWLFLTSLSAFELASGLMLMAGLLVRPLSIIWGLLLWTFVFSLPVTTTPGAAAEISTYTAPALLVQVRDVALSGLFFALYNMGSGAAALDRRIGIDALYGPRSSEGAPEAIALLMRLSLALPLLVGGFFHGMDDITTFGMPAALLAIPGLMLTFAVYPRMAAIATGAMMLVFIALKLNFDQSLIANLNSFKREFALAAAAFVVAQMGGGKLFSAPFWLQRSLARSPVQAAP